MILFWRTVFHRPVRKDFIGWEGWLWKTIIVLCRSLWNRFIVWNLGNYILLPSLWSVKMVMLMSRVKLSNLWCREMWLWCHWLILSRLLMMIFSNDGNLDCLDEVSPMIQPKINFWPLSLLDYFEVGPHLIWGGLLKLDTNTFHLTHNFYPLFNEIHQLLSTSFVKNLHQKYINLLFDVL